jgi:hypothetical protein
MHVSKYSRANGFQCFLTSIAWAAVGVDNDLELDIGVSSCGFVDGGPGGVIGGPDIKRQ